MMNIHQRIAELWVKGKHGGMDEDEQKEMITCMNANADYAFKLSKLHNLSLIAYEMEDHDWHHQICADIEALEEKYNKQVEKKPDAK